MVGHLRLASFKILSFSFVSLNMMCLGLDLSLSYLEFAELLGCID